MTILNDPERLKSTGHHCARKDNYSDIEIASWRSTGNGLQREFVFDPVVRIDRQDLKVSVGPAIL
jgi:hypothetical protein